jgi:ATP-binding cassette subfamily C protein
MQKRDCSLLENNSFWKVQEGRVSISGTSVEQINTGNLRDMESFMTQETYLFHYPSPKNV